MKKTVLKDFNSILQLFKENTQENALEIILNCEQTSEYGLMLTSMDKATGYHVMYSVQFIFDSEENRVSIDNSYYDTLSGLQQRQLSENLERILLRSDGYELSKGFTAFTVVTQLAINIDNVIGAVVYMLFNGGDDNAPIKTYQLIDTDS